METLHFVTFLVVCITFNTVNVVFAAVPLEEFYKFGIRGGDGDRNNGREYNNCNRSIYDDNVGPGYDDEHIETLVGPLAYPIFGNYYASAFVSENGVVEFEDYSDTYEDGCSTATLNPSYPALYPYWGNARTTFGGAVLNRVSIDKKELKRNAAEIAKACRDQCGTGDAGEHHAHSKGAGADSIAHTHGQGSDGKKEDEDCVFEDEITFPVNGAGGSCFFGYNPIALFIVTWYRIPHYASGCPDNEPTTLRNTFQLVLSTDGYTTYAIYLYNSLEWTSGVCTGFGNPAPAGLSNGDGVTYNLDGSCTEPVIDIQRSSNVGRSGVYIFRIDRNVQDVCGIDLVTPSPV